MKIGIIGYGWIGQATKKLFPDAQIYDKFIPEYQQPLYECDLAFLAVPTPWTGGKGLDCSAVEDAIANCGCDFIVIRSATQPGFCHHHVEPRSGYGVGYSLIRRPSVEEWNGEPGNCKRRKAASG